MSWFSIGLHGKSAWDSHSFVNSICTGGIVGSYVVQQIKDLAINCYMRETIAGLFAEKVAPQITPYSRDIAVKFLEHTIRREKIGRVGGKLLKRLFHVSKDDFKVVGKMGVTAVKNVTTNYWKNWPNTPLPNEDAKTKLFMFSMANMATFVHLLYANFKSEEVQAILKLVGGLKFSDATQKILILSLLPACEKAVQASLVALTKASGRAAYDFTLKRAISLTLMPVLYNMVFGACEWAAKNYASEYEFDYVTKYVPSPSTVQWGTAACNIADMSYGIWRTYASIDEQHDLDKENVKELAFKHAKVQVERKIKENTLLSFIGVSQDQKMIDNLVKTLIHESVDLYWEDLHKVKVLGLPLVT